MANLTETATYSAGVYQLEVTDQVLGGAGGIANSQAQNLANRTAYLKAITDSLVGVVVPYAGVSAPSGWLFCYGQAVSRTTYAALFNTLTIRPTGNTTSGSLSISSVSQDLTTATLGFSIIGMPISGPGIPAGATVTAVTSTTLTLSANATATASGVSLVIAPHGVGDGSTTFNVPDSRGRAVAGRDDMGGTAANVLQVTTNMTTTAGSATATVASATGLSVGMTVKSANVPAGVTISVISGTTITLSTGTGVTAGTNVSTRFSMLGDAQALGSAGGSQTHTMLTNQMPSHAHTVGAVSSIGGQAAHTVTNTSAGTTTGSDGTGTVGGDQPHPNVQPTIVLNHIIKT